MALFKRKTPDVKKTKMEAKQAKQDKKYEKRLETIQILFASDLRPDETIQYYLCGNGEKLSATFLVLTETRVIFRERFTSKNITLDKITSVEKGLIKLTIKASNTEIEIDTVTFGDINTFVDKMYELQNETGETVEEQSVSLSPVQQLKEYKELLDLEIITQEEFDKKKKELLNL